jgi:hypothetical protein
MGLEQWPTQEQYIEAERQSAEPAAPPTNAPAGPIKIRWLTPSNYPGGRIWHMEELTFGPDERIFDRKTYENNKVYWSQDTRAHLTSDATCASVSLIYTRVSSALLLMSTGQSLLQNGHRVFVTTRGHSDTLDEDAVDVRSLSDQDRCIHADRNSARVHMTSQYQAIKHSSEVQEIESRLTNCRNVNLVLKHQ